MLDVGQLCADAVDGGEIVLVGTDDTRSGVIDHVGEVVGGEPVVEGDEHGPNLRHGVERLELRRVLAAM